MRAVELYRKAAKQGLAQAQFNLALMYDDGEGIAPDDAKAVKLYRKAAEQGHEDAINNLGYMYENGEGVKQDPVEAYAWHSLGGVYGCKPCTQAKNYTASQMKPGQLADGEKRAAACIKACGPAK